MKSPALKMVWDVAVVLSALCAIHVGLVELGFDVMAMGGLTELKMYVNYIFGIAGVTTLVLFIMGLVTDCDVC